MEKTTYVEELTEGKEIKDKFAVKEKMSPKEYSKGWYFKLIVGDKTGKIPLVYWGGSEEEMVRSVFRGIDVSDVIEVNGLVSSYRGELQISINEKEMHGIYKMEEEEYDPEDYMPRSSRNIDEMFSELLDLAKSIQNDKLFELVKSFLKDSDFVKEFKKAPYSKRYNNNYIGGLLEHTLADTQLAEKVAKMYEQIDHDLLVASAIVHDFGKIAEYNTGTSIELTRESQLVGHTVMCERIISDRMKEIEDFPEDLELKLKHIVLSHHGDYEWGSPRSPRLEEAVALHHIDLLNVRLSGFIQAKEELEPDDEEMIYVSKEGVQRPIFNR